MKMVEEKDGYCNKELDERKDHMYMWVIKINKTGSFLFSTFRVYLGLTDKSKTAFTQKYEIESVRVPRGRIEMYQKKIIAGPWDISLLRLREKVTLITRLVAPVSGDDIVSADDYCVLEPFLDLSRCGHRRQGLGHGH